jgi:polyisoprenoid-binding protein YceI
MHEEVLESERFPEALFTLDRVTGQISSQGPVLVHGILRIHGQDHEITVPARVSANDRQVSGSANFVVPYVKWGMKDPSTFVLRVKDTVNVTVNLVGTAS